MSLEFLAVLFLIVISKAICEDDKNITTANSKTASMCEEDGMNVTSALRIGLS